ncbi:MAG: hypothetical protein QNK90_10775 [Opitutaceae bacterium]
MHVRAASFAGENLASVVASQKWAELVTEETGGDVRFEFFLNGSLIGAPDVYAGVGSGTAEMGIESHGYQPVELPLSHAQNVGYLSSNAQASAAVQRDFYENDAGFRAEWDVFSPCPVFFGMETVTVLGCKEPITSLDDLKGINVRAAALMTEDFNSVGANVSGLVASEMLDAFQGGVIDCWSAVGGTVTQSPDALVSQWRAIAAPANVKRFLEIAGPDGQAFLDEWESALKAKEAEYSAY